MTPLPGPGIIVGTATIAAKHDAVAAFVRATLKAMNEIAAAPSVGVDAAIKAVPDLASNRPLQEAVLEATIADWRPSGAAAEATITGAVDTAAWDKTVTFMTSLGLVPKPVTASDLVDTTFIPVVARRARGRRPASIRRTPRRPDRRRAADPIRAGGRPYHRSMPMPETLPAGLPATPPFTLRARVVTPLADGGVLDLADGLVEIGADGRIAAVGPVADRPDGEAPTDAIDLRPWVVLPGMVDLHAHLPQVANAGLGYGLPLLGWLDRLTFPTERAWADPAVAERLAPAIFRAFAAAGTTTVVGYGVVYEAAMDVAFRAAEAHGIRAILGKVMMDRLTYDATVDPATILERTLRESADLAGRWHGAADGRLGYAVTPRFAISCTAELLAASAALAKDLGCWWQTHLAEDPAECRRGGPPLPRDPRLPRRLRAGRRARPRGRSSPTPSTSPRARSAASPRAARGSPTARPPTSSWAPERCHSPRDWRPGSRSGSAPTSRAGPSCRSSASCARAPTPSRVAWRSAPRSSRAIGPGSAPRLAPAGDARRRAGARPRRPVSARSRSARRPT